MAFVLICGLIYSGVFSSKEAVPVATASDAVKPKPTGPIEIEGSHFTNVGDEARDPLQWDVSEPNWDSIAEDVKRFTSGRHDTSYNANEGVVTTRPIAMVGTSQQVNETSYAPLLMVYCSANFQNVKITDYYFERADAHVVMNVLFEADVFERTGLKSDYDQCKALEFAGRQTSKSTFVWRHDLYAKTWMNLGEARGDVTFKNEIFKPDQAKADDLRREKRNEEYKKFEEKLEKQRLRREARRAQQGLPHSY